MEFQFREFTVRHERSAMKVGTDSVLLGCFCDTSHAETIFDIGTGTGLLALMLAQKSDALIDAVEIDPVAIEEAKGNFERSKWKERLQIHSGDVKAFKSPVTYDLIITNPPYYTKGKNVPIADEQRSKARHDSDLSFEELCSVVMERLSDHGMFWLILPFEESKEWKQVAERGGLFLNREIKIKPKPDKEMNRVISSYGKREVVPVHSEFIIYEKNGEATEEYYQLTKNYLLWTGREE